MQDDLSTSPYDSALCRRSRADDPPSELAAQAAASALAGMADMTACEPDNEFRRKRPRRRKSYLATVLAK